MLGVAPKQTSSSINPALPLRKAKVAAMTKMMVLANTEPVEGEGEEQQQKTPKAASRGKVTAKPRIMSPSPHRLVLRAGSPTSVMHISSAALAREVKKKSKVRGGRHKNRKTFPVKLFNLLEGGKYKQAIDWTEDGEAFVIKDKSMLEKVLPEAGFSHMKLRSFHRQCSYWCFQRRRVGATTTPRKNNKTALTGDDAAASIGGEEWYHPYFVMGMHTSSLTSIVRRGFKGHSIKKEGVTIFLKEKRGGGASEKEESTSKSSSSVSGKAIYSSTASQGVLPRRINFDQPSPRCKDQQQEQYSGDTVFPIGLREQQSIKTEDMVTDHIDGGGPVPMVCDSSSRPAKEAAQETGGSLFPSSCGVLQDHDRHFGLFFLKADEEDSSTAMDFSFLVDEDTPKDEEVEDFLRSLPIHDMETDRSDDEDCLSSFCDLFSIADQALIGEESILTAAV